MGSYLNITGYSSKNSKEFQKHYKAVEFCLENKLSYPKETQIFFDGMNINMNYDDFNDSKKEYILETIKNGIKIPIKIDTTNDKYEIKLKVSDIPKEVDEIIFNLI